MRLHSGEPIRNNGRHDSNLCRLDQGAARLCATGSVKSRLILDFLMPGDFFVLPSANEKFVIEATMDDTIAVIYSELPNRQLLVSKVFHNRSYDELIINTAERFQRQILILGSPSEAARCLAFLRDMATRLNCRRGNPRQLPICLSDIANYLALRPSEVEEMLMCCEMLGAVNLRDRSYLTIVDPELLMRISDQDLPVAGA